MAQEKIPHAHNSVGHGSITLGVKQFKCMGALPPFDHPHVFIDMGADNETVCPYCSTHYTFDARLGSDQSNPVDCLYK